MRACVDCGRIISSGARCLEHKRAYETARGSASERGYGPEYRRLRADVLAEESTCWFGDGGEREGDPWTVHHVLPLELGGLNVRENLHLAHRSCNTAAGSRVAGVISSEAPNL